MGYYKNKQIAEQEQRLDPKACASLRQAWELLEDASCTEGDNNEYLRDKIGYVADEAKKLLDRYGGNWRGVTE